MTEAATHEDVRRLITLVRGVMEKGGSYWCYLAVKPELINKFQKAVSAKYNIQNFVKDAYGEVVVSGTGREPPQEITAQVSKMFNVSFQEIDHSDTNFSIANTVEAQQAPKL